MLSLVIQAGGESRRMGRDKGMVPFLGQPLVERLLERLGDQAGEIIITTNNPAPYRYLGVPLVPDRIPGRGALGGLFTALSAARHALVAVVACDMPFASAGLLGLAVELMKDEAYGGVIPRSEAGTEPFHAVYRREVCLPAVQEIIAAGRWKVNAWFPRVQIYYLEPEEYRVYDPYALAFLNVNSPEDLEAAEARALELGEIRRSNP